MFRRLSLIDHRIDFDAERIVKPKAPSYQPLNILAVDLNSQTLWTESTGEIQSLSQLPIVVLQEPPSIIVGYEVGVAIKELADAFADQGTFQAKITPVQRELTPWKVGQDRTVMDVGVSFAYIGWRKSKNKKSGWKVKHYPLDPFLFTASYKPEYRTHDRSLQSVARWAIDVREFLEANGLSFRATQSGIAAQLLKHPKFYPEPRRKIPKQTNAKVRDTLPGNFYQYVGANPKLTYQALEVDQEAAHHSCASTLQFPSANGLYAKGYFAKLPDKPFAVRGTKLYERLLSSFGLFYVRITPPIGARTQPFLLPAADYAATDSTGKKLVFVYSNELDDLRETGATIDYVIAAWTSEEQDEGLNQLALWSLEQIAASSPERKRWLKPLLLSSYGLLAAKPKPLRTGYLQGKGEPQHFHVGRGEVMRFFTSESKFAVEPGFANVVHRGMIEAETRKRSLQMARWLTKHGFQVLTVYADAVYCAGSKHVPFLPPGWSTKEISNAHFPNANQIVCDQFEKLPGLHGRRRKTLADTVRGKRKSA